MGIIANIKARMQARKIASVQLMTEKGNRYMSWNGRVYDFDVVRACIRPKVKAIGKLVGKQIRETIKQDGSREFAVNPNVNIKMLLEEPNPIMSGQMLQEKLATQLCINNNAFALILRDDMGAPVEIYPIVPAEVEADYKDGPLHMTFTMPNRADEAAEGIESTGIIAHMQNTSNPHQVTAEQVGAMAVDAIQSGSNSNGSWIKWPDGTMECWGQVSGTSDSSGYLTVTFPVAFATTPAAFLVSGVSGSGVVERGSLTATQGKVGFRSYINGDFLANQASRAAAWHAIGRWK